MNQCCQSAGRQRRDDALNIGLGLNKVHTHRKSFHKTVATRQGQSLPSTLAKPYETLNPLRNSLNPASMCSGLVCAYAEQVWSDDSFQTLEQLARPLSTLFDRSTCP